ncbi:MAG: ABC transporter ATP-binding protein, partial [Coriobacteriia bacterium]|nr:ABC transporter ATP-binding protein [Coriobacteriia bacterium]
SKQDKERSRQANDARKRNEAEARNRVYRELKEDRLRLADLEKELDHMNLRYEELMEDMADQKLYQDRESFDQALKEYQELKQQIPRLEAEWFDITARIDAADSVDSC